MVKRLDRNAGDYWFVDKHGTVLQAKDAKCALAKKNDLAYLTEGSGVLSVPLDRWREAQEYEETYWTNRPLITDDRNEDHAREFEGYKVLRGMSFKHAMEIGCGPFTNLRILASQCEVARCTLLDPLIASYLELPNCRYTRQILYCDSRLTRLLGKNRIARVGRGLLRRTLPSALRSLRRTVSVEALVSSPIESFDAGKTRFDLIVMMNVIEHCYDINLVFARLLSIAQPDAVLVFADKYYDPKVVSSLLDERYYEAGHPLMVGKNIVDGFLSANFDTKFRRIAKKRLRHLPLLSRYEAIYFIGKLR